MRKFLILIVLFAYPLFSNGAVIGDWTYSVLYGGAIISKYSGAGGVVTIPSMLGAFPVRQVGNGQPGEPPIFGYYNTSVTSVIIPPGVTSIGNTAFLYCFGLTSVSIPNTVTSIGEGAFSSCRSLTSLSIPNSITTIASETFLGCTALTSLSIPNSITTIGWGAFTGCGLTSLTIPSTVTSIGNEAFAGCSQLTNLIIENGVLSIGRGAFYSCTSLRSVTIPDSVIILGDLSLSGGGSDVGVFQGCTNLVSISIGINTTMIGRRTFSGCTSLTSITIPTSVSNIEYEAFANCPALARIVFLGNPPSYDATSFLNSSPTVYHVAGTTGWEATFATLTTTQLNQPSIQSFVLNANGNTQLTWTSMQGVFYEIQSTDSLDNPFVTRSTRTATNTLETWNEPDANMPSKRFYRVSMRLP